MGEPLAASVSEWYAFTFLGSSDHPVINTYFQTETGGILAAQRSTHTYRLDNPSIGEIPNYLTLDTYSATN